MLGRPASRPSIPEEHNAGTAVTDLPMVDRAKGLVVNQIERLVASHQVGDLPDDPPAPNLEARVVRLELPPEVFALWRQARMVVAEERGMELSDADFVETLCRAAIAPGTGASGPTHQIAYQQCPDCRRATQNGAGRQIEVAPEVFERASCDARNLGSLDAAAPERATSTLTPRIRSRCLRGTIIVARYLGADRGEISMSTTLNFRVMAADMNYLM